MGDIEKAVKVHHDGAILNLFVTTGANKAFFPAGYNKWRRRVEIKVSSPAKDNQANKDVIKTSAMFFNKPIEQVLILSGKKSREKSILIKDMSADSIVKMLQEKINGL